MDVQVNTDDHVVGSEQLMGRVKAEVEAALSRFEHQITRVEVFLNDVNAQKAGDNDKRCLVEARPAGLRPIVTSHRAPTVFEAVDGAVEKLERSLDAVMARRSDRKGQVSFSGDPESV